MPHNLRCEYLVDPVGIDAKAPRLSWLPDEQQRRGFRQQAYRILAATRPELLEEGNADLWDSQKVESSRSTQVRYEGVPLDSRTQVFWKVKIWDDRGDDYPYSEPANWEMGLLQPDDWMAGWITLAKPEGEERPCPYLRTEFTLPSSPKRARAYASALGLYRLSVNDSRVGHGEFTPGWTDYRKRVQYESYEITPELREGANEVVLVLGDGWYCGQVGLAGPQVYGEWPEAIAQLEIDCEDGSRHLIATDESWRGSFGAIRSSDLLIGEVYDSRIEPSEWSEVVAGQGSPGMLVARRSEPVTSTEEVRAVMLTEPLPGTFVYNLGQNIVGRVRLRVEGPAGTEVTLRHAEMLNPDGTIYTENLRKADQTDRFILGGGGEEIYEPTFTFHGFQYVEVTGWPGTPTIDSITGVVLHSECAPVGRFACSNPLLNRLQENIRWGQRGNFLEVPTDCPQRDERLGWMGDAQVFAPTACFNMDVAAFFSKWLADVADAQTEEGAFTNVAPDVASLIRTESEYGRLVDGSPGWGCAGIIVPWVLYQWYGDDEFLRFNYEGMQRWISFIQERNPDLLWINITGWNFGDWLSIEAETPKDVIATAYFAHSADLMSKIADILKRRSDARKYRALFSGIKKAFIDAYVGEEGRIQGETQTVYATAITFGILPPNLKRKAARRLLEDVRNRKWHLSTGFLGVSHLLSALTTASAYRLLEQETYPSWLYPVRQGATTIWERWDGWTESSGFQSPKMNSFNHYAYGSVGEWIYRRVGGIDLIEPGFSRILIEPQPGGSIEWAETEYQSIRGKIACRWRREGDEFRMSVEIPPNTAATIVVPARPSDEISEGDVVPAEEAEGLSLVKRTRSSARFEAGSGSYEFLAK